MSLPIPVLKPGIIYSGDNGMLICSECAGMSALYTGHDRSGLKVLAVPYEETLEWFAEFKIPMACECGLTVYPLTN